MANNETRRGDTPLSKCFQIDGWEIHPGSNTIIGPKGEVRVEPKVMDLLVLLARNSGVVVSRDEILATVWPNTFVSDAVLYKAISELRRVFRTDQESSRMIETIPKRGYRLNGTISHLDDPGVSEGTTAGKTRSESPVSTKAPAPVKSVIRGRWKWGIMAAGLMAVLLALVLRTVLHSDPTLVDQQPRTVLITQIENHTGEPDLDGTLEYALEQRLLDSGLMQIVSRERIEDTLALMRKPPDSFVDETLGRQICKRDPGINLLLTGRIDKVGEVYRLGFQMLDSSKAEKRVIATRETGSRDGLLEAVSDLAEQLTDGVASAGFNRRGSDIPRVTTDSIEALILYSKGVEFYSGRSDSVGAESLFSEAVRIDPEFAYAHFLLAWCMRNQGRTEEALKVLEHAVSLKEGASLVERAHMQGTYHRWRNEPEKAAAQLELVLDLQPEHRWASNGLVGIYRELGEADDEIRIRSLRAEGRPNNLEVQCEEADQLLSTFGEVAGASRLVERARRLLAEQPEADRVGWGGKLRFPFSGFLRDFEIWMAWYEGDLNRALEIAESDYEKLIASNEKLEDLQWTATTLGGMFLALGRIRRAEELFVRFRIGFDSHYLRENLALLRRSSTALRCEWVPSPDGATCEVSNAEVALSAEQWSLNPHAATALVALAVEPAGIEPLDAAEHSVPEGVTTWFNPTSPSTGRNYSGLALGSGQLLEGGLLWSKREFEGAIPRLEKGLKLLSSSPGFPVPDSFIGSLVLADAYIGSGDLPRAAEVLARVSARRNYTFPVNVVPWQLARTRLAKLYRQMGRMDRAEEIESELRDLLRLADPDHPVLQALNRSDQSESGEVQLRLF